MEAKTVKPEISFFEKILPVAQKTDYIQSNLQYAISQNRYS